jgi:hypothetical protein
MDVLSMFSSISHLSQKTDVDEIFITHASHRKDVDEISLTHASHRKDFYEISISRVPYQQGIEIVGSQARFRF